LAQVSILSCLCDSFKTWQAMSSDCALFLVSITSLIGLFEIMFTVFNFDEDSYGILQIALVFYLEPIISAIFKFCMVGFMRRQVCICDFLFEVVSESLQCWLYVRYCSYSDQAMLWLILSAVTQVFLKTCAMSPFCADEGQGDGTQAEQYAEAIDSMGKDCAPAICGAVIEGVGMLLLLIPGDSPFKEKTFEVPFAFMCWLLGYSMAAQYVDKQETFDGQLGLWFAWLGACMVPYTVILTVHHYMKSAFPAYVISLVMGSCFICGIMCMTCAQKSASHGSDEEEEEDADEEE